MSVHQQQPQQWPPQQGPYGPPTQPWIETSETAGPPRRPYLPPPRPPRPPAKKTSPLTVVLVVGAILLVAVVGTVAKVATEGTPSAKPSATVATVPDYSVAKTRRNGADLLVKGATVESAQAAIRDWLERNAGDRDYLTVQVVRSADAKVYVCSAEYVADERTAQIKTGGRITADDYPTTVMNCPDPAGS
ncbi:hypothetical protein FLW53_23440 [Microbispora sp. SCL1-1]|uniref:hypothetical protein n=1 Tax=unclassified Microbispora TaxID=2614687 RepID=UPI0011598707|nr:MULTISPECIES: hypothetical protein [unclassified Microbispora]NJP27099.1 hypothetical protein [Microbispora sp. CL1-1]TQS11444.1 hypothetical protein FLW53_23440 [Microbispora sp. SCL1-1]